MSAMTQVAFMRCALGYDAASQQTSSPPVGSTGEMIIREGDRVRRRAADVIRNEGFYFNALRLLKFLVRGRLEVRARDVDGTATPAAKRATAAFVEWAKDCGFFHQRGTLRQVLTRVSSELLDTGEAYIQRVIDPSVLDDIGDPHRNGLFLQVWGGRDIERGQGSDGQKFSASGRYLGTYFRGVTNSAFNRDVTPVFIPASQLLEVRIADTAGATQGVSWGTAAIKPAIENQRADEAQLHNLRTRANLMAFAIAENTSPALNGQLMEPGPVLEDQDGHQVDDLRPASLVIARGVKSIEVVNPSGQTMAPSTRVQRIAAGIGIPVQSMTLDLSETNFAAARFGDIVAEQTATDLAERSGWERMRVGLIDWFVAREREMGERFDAFTWVWLNRVRRAIDPATEAKAQATRLQAGVTSKHEEIEADGRDPDIVLARIAQETDEATDIDDDAPGLRVVA